MTAEQLEELLGKVSPHYEGNDWCPEVNYDGMPVLEADWELIALAPTLARRVIAAEKLVGEVERVSRMISQRWQTAAGDKCFLALDDAATAYREASK